MSIGGLPRWAYYQHHLVCNIVSIHSHTQTLSSFFFLFLPLFSSLFLSLTSLSISLVYPTDDNLQDSSTPSRPAQPQLLGEDVEELGRGRDANPNQRAGILGCCCACWASVAPPSLSLSSFDVSKSHYLNTPNLPNIIHYF